MISGYKAVRRLAAEKPEWLPMVEASMILAKEQKEFAGSWVLRKVKEKGIEWFPGLRTLVSYGILRHEDTTRGGRRAYYSMPDPDGVKEALIELKVIK
jgi:hypothetical protein